MSNMIRVNGYIIDPAKVAMLDRKQFSGTDSNGVYSAKHSGVAVRFVGGGQKWIEDPEAHAVEAAFLRYDGVQESELPY